MMETIQTQPCIHAWDIPWEVLPLGSEHKQHSPQIRNKGWTKSINHVSYWAGWFWKKHYGEGSTAVFYDFCLAVGVMWSDDTFLFTAYTGAEASLFGGVTIS